MFLERSHILQACRYTGSKYLLRRVITDILLQKGVIFPKTILKKGHILHTGMDMGTDYSLRSGHQDEEDMCVIVDGRFHLL